MKLRDWDWTTFVVVKFETCDLQKYSSPYSKEPAFAVRQPARIADYGQGESKVLPCKSIFKEMLYNIDHPVGAYDDTSQYVIVKYFPKVQRRQPRAQKKLSDFKLKQNFPLFLSSKKSEF